MRPVHGFLLVLFFVGEAIKVVGAGNRSLRLAHIPELVEIRFFLIPWDTSEGIFAMQTDLVQLVFL